MCVLLCVGVVVVEVQAEVVAMVDKGHVNLKLSEWNWSQGNR